MSSRPAENARPSFARLRPRGRARDLLWGFLLGALAGTQVSGLIFFLNPHLSFDLLTVLSGTSFYSLLLGCAGLLLALPFTWRGAPVSRWLPVGLTLVLAASGLGAWIHASYFAFYLPPGINRRLLKAAIWLSLTSVTCFYTVLLHRMRHRPYGRRSRVLFGLMALASIYVVMERREAFRPTQPPAPRPTIFQASQRPQLYVVGLESATLDAILPLEEQGHLPFFSRLLHEGSHARLSSLRPTRRSALWTTLATGKYPYRHGVVGRSVFNAPFLQHQVIPRSPTSAGREADTSLKLLPLGIGFEAWGTWSTGRPADSTALRVRPLWEILSRLGMPTALVGWPVSSPPPVAIEMALADRFFETDGESRFAHPIELAERARLFRTDLEDIDPAITSSFGSDPPAAVLASLAEDLWRRDLSLFFLGQEPQIEALFVVFPGLAEISRQYFGGYSAVQFEGHQEPDSERAAQLISAYYMHLDDSLARLWDRSDSPRLLVVVSTHGAEGPRGWREARRMLLREPAVEGYLDQGSDGILMFLGEGIQTEAMLRPADLVDLVPTLLYGLGFPIARDLDGAVLTSAFETGFLARQQLTFLPSYEALADRGD